VVVHEWARVMIPADEVVSVFGILVGVTEPGRKDCSL
jgi:hypothetical protein